MINDTDHVPVKYLNMFNRGGGRGGEGGRTKISFYN